MAYRVVAPHVTVRTANTLGLGAGGYMSVGVDHGRLLPVDAPVKDVARLLRRGLVEPVDGEVPAEVAAAVAVLDAEAEARRAPVPELSPAERLTNALARAGRTGSQARRKSYRSVRAQGRDTPGPYE
jgi:hypothetical protein